MPYTHAKFHYGSSKILNITLLINLMKLCISSKTSCGFLLAIGGMLVLFDNERVMVSKLLTNGELSNLPHPLLYYISIGLSLLGLVLAATGILGCWASCLHNYCLLTLYFIIIMMILIGECAIYTIAWAWPNCMGIGLDMEDLIKSLQKNYGAGGQEQFTAALDLAQTMFSCCGIESANEYDTSLWRLQSLGPSLAIPLSCCKLLNANQPKAYLNPIPVNSQLCQALERPRHQGYRHIIGCKGELEQWYRNHYAIFLGVGFIVVFIEFIVLLSTILMCTRIYHHNQETKTSDIYLEETETVPATKETSFQKRPSSSQAYSNETYAMTGNFDKDYTAIDRA